MADAISSGKVVLITLTSTDVETGKTLQRFTEDNPTLYLHGYNNLVDSLEKLLEGTESGTDFDWEVRDAYGPSTGVEVNAVPKKEFPRTWKLEAGLKFTVPAADGKQVTLYVHGVRGSRVMVSPEHPWAGKTIRFVGKVLGMRNASDHERGHGHAHGPGGHVH